MLISLSIEAEAVTGFDFNAKNIDPELLCLVSSSYYEKKYNIPKNLLRSISIVESGKWNREHKMTFAWPWIVGIDGKGEYFKSYGEAAAFLRKAVARGANVDIGCHQINWKYHGHHFNKPEELLHPKINAAYAAHFLIEKFNSSKDWSKAVAHYHSHTPEFGDRYLKKVHNVLENMKGQNGHKYNEYLNSKTSNLRQNKNLLYEANHRLKQKATQDRYITTNNRDIIANTQKVNQASDIVVFSVELPANSTILEN
jgi:hypothetical protein